MITVLMLMLVISFSKESISYVGVYHTGALVVAAAIALTYFKLHPTIVVSSSLIYGALFLG